MTGFKLLREPNLDARLAAFDYQQEAVEQIKSLEYGAIFHEQGLGKTKIAIDVLLSWQQEMVVDSVVLVVKKSLIANWREELETHSHIRPRLLTQDRKGNFHAFNSPVRVYLTNYEVIKSELARFRLFLEARSVGIIMDEAHKIKNPDAALTKAFMALSPQFKRRLILTGTPIANRPYDIWSLINFLDHGEHLGKDFEDFKSMLDLPDGSDDGVTSEFESALASIFPKISDFCVRETKNGGCISLPKKEYITIRTEWESRQHEIYGDIRDDLGAVIVANGVPTYDESEGILKRLLRLVQVASNPAILDESYKTEPGKYSYLEYELNRIIANGEKAIVWTSFIKNADWLNKKLSRYSPAKIHGKMNIEDRNWSIRKFKNDPECKVLIATPGAAKEGLTLTVANHVLFYDRSFSLDDYLQAQDRIHRISQSKKCYVYNFIMEDSVDEWVEALLEAKEYAAKMGQGDINASDFTLAMNYDFAEILRRILGLDEVNVLE